MIRHKSRATKQSEYKRAFAKILLAKLGPTYPVSPSDFDSADYWCSIGKPVEEAAGQLAEDRKIAMSTNAVRSSCKAWFADDGEFRCEPCVPPEVQATVRAAVDNGCTHGTIFHWARVLGNYSSFTDVRAEIYCWEKL